MSIIIVPLGFLCVNYVFLQRLPLVFNCPVHVLRSRFTRYILTESWEQGFFIFIRFYLQASYFMPYIAICFSYARLVREVFMSSLILLPELFSVSTGMMWFAFPVSVRELELLPAWPGLTVMEH